MMLMKDSWSVCTCCTRYVGNDIQDRQLEYLLYAYKTNCCVDTLNTEARATVLRSVGQIALVCGTIPLSVKLSSATMTSCTVDLADSRPCLAPRLVSSDLTLHW